MEPSIATFIMWRAACERPLTEQVRDGNGRCYTRSPILAAPSPPVLPTLPHPSPPPSPATPTPSARDRPNPRHQQLAPSPPLFPDHWRTPSPCPPPTPANHPAFLLAPRLPSAFFARSLNRNHPLRPSTPLSPFSTTPRRSQSPFASRFPSLHPQFKITKHKISAVLRASRQAGLAGAGLEIQPRATRCI